MGSKVKSAITAPADMGGIVTGKGPLAKALGLSGEQGEYMQNAEGNGALDQMNARQSLYANDGFNSAINSYASGGSLESALAGRPGMQQDEMRNALAIDPTTGSRMATDQVQNNAILGQLFGKGGSMEGARSEEKDLMSRGYSLQPEDHEAYGQASGNIARLFGQQENDLAQSLASRGLSQAGSGAALAGFAGLQGNKMEQLAASQRNIADSRMKNTMERLNSTRSYLSGLGQQGASAIQDQFGRQLAGVQQKQGAMSDAAAQTTNNNAMLNAGRQASLEDKRGAKGSTLLEGFGQGLYSSSANVGAAPGKFVSSAAGAKGQAMGGGK